MQNFKSKESQKRWEESIIKSRETQKRKYLKVRKDYANNPKLCKNCKEPLPFEKKFQTFCSQSCSAKLNNKGKRRHGKGPGYCLNCKNKVKRYPNVYCSNKCQAEYKYKTYIEKWYAGEEQGAKGSLQLSRHIRKHLLEITNQTCQECGWNKINPYSGKSPLEVHHKDGDHKNNMPENLTLLCPNCHSLTKSYKALNIGKGRELRRK